MASLLACYRFRNSQISREFVIWNNSARVDIVTDLVWNDRLVLVKAEFPLGRGWSSVAVESPMGVQRHSAEWMRENERERFEFPAHRCVDVEFGGYGFAVVNDSRYGYGLIDDVLSLTLVSSPRFPDPMSGEGRHRTTYSVFPHLGDWELGGVDAEALDLNSPIWAVPSVNYGLSDEFATVSDVNLGLSCLKMADDGDGLVCRVFEQAGRQGHGAMEFVFREPWYVAGEVDVRERALEGLSMEYTPYQMRSYRLRPATVGR